MLKNARFAALAVALVTAQCMFAQNLVSSEYLGDRSLSNLQAQFGPLIQNGVKLYKLTYTTPDAFSQPDTASGLIAVPDRSGDWAYPLLCFQHGTVDSRSDAPSNLRGGYQAALVFGGMGYISIMPDFLGIGDSRGFHPYVHAATEASVGVDMLRAAEAFVQTLNHVAVNPEQQVFVCGYSQGGHAAMALQRSLEQDYPDEFNLIASAPMSGPYSISGAMIDALSSDDEYFYPAYIPNTFLSYNYVYGLYDSIQQAFKEPYAGLMQQYFEEQITLSELNAFWPRFGQVGIAQLRHALPAMSKAGAKYLALADAGDRVTAPEFYAALELVRALRSEASTAFAEWDVIMTPSAAAQPWPASEPFPPEIDGQPVGPRGHAIYTGWVNAAGLPAINLPATPDSRGLPIGFQLVGDRFTEAMLFDLADSWEKAGPGWSWPKVAEQ